MHCTQSIYGIWYFFIKQAAVTITDVTFMHWYCDNKVELLGNVLHLFGFHSLILW